MPEKQLPEFDVFTVEERGDRNDPKRPKAVYTKIGAGWRTKSGEGLNVVVVASTLNGRYLLLPHRPLKEAEDTNL